MLTFVYLSCTPAKQATADVYTSKVWQKTGRGESNLWLKGTKSGQSTILSLLCTIVVGRLPGSHKTTYSKVKFFLNLDHDLY